MKKILLVMVLFMTMLFAELDWALSYEEGLVEAKKENKLVILMFSSKTCKVCKYMKNKVYENSEVSDYIDEYFIAIEVDIDDYPKKYGYKVIGTPTYYFLDSQGKQIGEVLIGGAKAKNFLGLLKDIQIKR